VGAFKNMLFFSPEIYQLLGELDFIEYIRRSSRDNEDKQMRSLEGQEMDLDLVISDYKIRIIDFLKESQSAFEMGRPLFSQMMSSIEDGRANAVLVWHPNRIARNYQDGGRFVQLMADGKLKLVVTPHAVFQNNARDMEYLMTEFTRATRDSGDKSEAVIRGNKIKLKSGYIPSGRLPEGYIHVKNTHDKFINDIDPERFHLLQSAIKLVLSRQKTPMKALRILNNEMGYRTKKTKRTGGTPLARSTWYKILSNPASCGMLENRKSALSGQKASFTSLVTPEEFEQLQIILGNKGRPHFIKHDFPYKEPLKCGYCGGSVTAEEKWHIRCTVCKQKFQKAKTRDYCPYCKTLIEKMDRPWMKKFISYSCVKGKKRLCKQRSVNIKVIESKIVETLSRFEIPEHLKEWAIQYLNELHDSETADREKYRGNLENAKSDCIKRLDNLVKLKISPQNSIGEVLSDSEYNKQRQLIMDEKTSVEKEIMNINQRMERWHELSVNTFNFACYARYWFEKGDVKTKTQILAALGSHLVIKDKEMAIDGAKQFFLIEKGKEEVENLAKKFAPAKYLDVMAHLDSYEPLHLSWLRD